jgi:hypothetical protein
MGFRDENFMKGFPSPRPLKFTMSDVGGWYCEESWIYFKLEAVDLI